MLTMPAKSARAYPASGEQTARVGVGLGVGGRGMGVGDGDGLGVKVRVGASVGVILGAARVGAGAVQPPASMAASTSHRKKRGGSIRH